MGIKDNFIYKIYKDISNFIFFRKIINKELKNKSSLLNRYNVSTNIFKNKLGVIITVKEEYNYLDDFNKNMMLLETITPINKYLDQNLGLCELLNISDPDNFLDEKNNPTLSFLILYSFNFSSFTVNNLIKLGLLTGLLYTIIKIDAWNYLKNILIN
ncbi:MAG: hypothetical protein RSE41_02625 [Clostridia bacterium]